MPAKKKVEKAKRYSDSELYVLADEFEANQRIAAAATKKKAEAQSKITGEFLQRKPVPKALEVVRNGRVDRITFVQQEVVEHDADALWDDMTPAQRRATFIRNVDLNALSADARKRVTEALTKEELTAVTSYVLDPEKLSQAVQADKVPAKLVAKHSELKKKAPYISYSHGSVE